MILNKILNRFFPNRIWALAFFLLVSFSAVLFISILLSVNDLAVLNRSFKKPSIVVVQKRGNISLLNLDEKSSHYDPLTLLEQIDVLAVRQDSKKAKIRIKESFEEIEIEENRPIYFQFDASGKLYLGEISYESPVYFLAKLDKNKVSLEVYRLIKGKNEYSKVGQSHKEPLYCSEEKERMKKYFSDLQIKTATLFDQMYRENNMSPWIELNGKRFPIHEGDCLGFDGQELIEKPTPSSYVLIVQSLDKNRAVIDCLDPSNFYSYKIEKTLKGSDIRFFSAIEEPKQVVLRGINAIQCLFYGKKITMKEGDFFYKEGASWKKIVSLEEFNQLIEYKLKHEIFVVERIYQQEKTIFLSGKIFDSTGWNYMPLSWKFERKKEKRSKEIPKTDPSVQDPFETTDRHDLGAVDEVL